MFGVCRKTIYADMVFLSTRYPVDAKGGWGGGFYIALDNWHLNVRHFSKAQAAAVRKALATAIQQGDTEQANALEEILKLYCWRHE